MAIQKFEDIVVAWQKAQDMSVQVLIPKKDLESGDSKI